MRHVNAESGSQTDPPTDTITLKAALEKTLQRPPSAQQVLIQAGGRGREPESSVGMALTLTMTHRNQR